MPFKPEEFLAQPDEEAFAELKKEDLVPLAKHLNLDVRKSMKKGKIQSIIAKHLVDEEKFPESALKNFPEPVDSAIELQKIQMEFELKKLEMQAKEQSLELERQKLEMQEREKEREREMQEREKEREMKKTLELEKQRMAHELEMKKLEAGVPNLPRSNHDSNAFDVAKYIKLVPPFQEKEVDKYFLHFEKIAVNFKWPKDQWVLLVQSVLTGRAREVYTQLSVDQASNYDLVKEYIMKAYELVPEAYRQKFRHWRKENNQTFVEFARIKTQLFDRWCASQNVDQDFENLRQLVLVEEFKRCVPNEIKTFIDEQKAETIDKAATLADDYSLTHKVTFGGGPAQSNAKQGGMQSKSSFDQNQKSNSSDENSGGSSPTSNSQTRNQTSSSAPLSSVVCNYCKKEGHLIADCFKLKRKTEQGQTQSMPTGFVSSRDSQIPVDVPDGTFTNTKKCYEGQVVSSDTVMEVFEPFLHNGFVSLSSDLSNPTPIRILRDTGSSQSLLLADTLPFSETSFSGSYVLIQGVDSSACSSVPLHNLRLSSDFVNGPVTVGLRSSLPFKGVQMILGNDLAGRKVQVNSVLTKETKLCQNPDSVVQQIPTFDSSCAVTKAHSEKSQTENASLGFDLADTFFCQLLESRPDSELDRSDFAHHSLKIEHQNDLSLKKSAERKVDESEISNQTLCSNPKGNSFPVKSVKNVHCENDVDNEFSVKYEQMAVLRIENSDMFRDLDSKFSHFRENQSREVNNIICDREHLSHNVPAQTYKAFHDVDTGDSVPDADHSKLRFSLSLSLPDGDRRSVLPSSHDHDLRKISPKPPMPLKPKSAVWMWSIIIAQIT